MDSNRVSQIDSILFRRMLKEKKVTINAAFVTEGIAMGTKLGIDQTIMRAYVAELVVELANAAFGNACLFQLTSNVTKVSDEMRTKIECTLFAEYFRSRRLRLDKHMVDSYVIECEKIGITHEEAMEYVIFKLSKMLAEAIA